MGLIKMVLGVLGFRKCGNIFGRWVGGELLINIFVWSLELISGVF